MADLGLSISYLGYDIDERQIELARGRGLSGSVAFTSNFGDLVDTLRSAGAAQRVMNLSFILHDLPTLQIFGR